MEFSGHQFDQNTEACLPPGFRFHPTDEELITFYLLPKVLDGSFTSLAFSDVDLNRCEPWELPRKAKIGVKEWYFFSLRDRKYPTGLRTNRATVAGYWKATGKDRQIYSSKTSALVGMKKTLVFYRGRAPNGCKSNWVMHEYRLDGKFSYHFISRNSKDEWVISRVFKKTDAGPDVGGGNGVEKKWSISITSDVNNDKEASCSSAVMGSLPPLLDSSLYATATSTFTTGDESYPYVSTTVSNEHVPCFSTESTTDFNSQTLFDYPPPEPLTSFSDSNNAGVSALSFYPAIHGSGGTSNYVSSSGEKTDLPPSDKQKPGPTELDCIWSF